MPKATRVLSTRRTTASEFLTTVNRLQISLMIRDPFVRSAFERAERDGSSPSLVAVDRPQIVNGGAAKHVLEIVEA